MDLIHPVRYFRSIFSTCVVSESQAYRLSDKHFLLGISNIHKQACISAVLTHAL